VKSWKKALAGNSNIDRFSTYVGSGAIRFYLPMDVLLENENIAQMVVVAKDLGAGSSASTVKQDTGDAI
jgi:hypothetical protein